MKTKLHGTLVDRAKTIAHHPRPNAARGPVLGDFFKEIIVRIKEERDTGHESFNVEARPNSPIDILDAITQSKCQFLQRRGPGLANVIAANRNWVVTWHVLRTELEGVDNQLH